MKYTLLLCLLALMTLSDVHNFLIHACALFLWTSLGWLHSIMLIPTYSIISCGNMFFDLHLFGLLPFLQEHNHSIYQGTFLYVINFLSVCCNGEYSRTMLSIACVLKLSLKLHIRENLCRTLPRSRSRWEYNIKMDK